MNTDQYGNTLITTVHGELILLPWHNGCQLMVDIGDISLRIHDQSVVSWYQAAQGNYEAEIVETETYGKSDPTNHEVSIKITHYGELSQIRFSVSKECPHYREGFSERATLGQTGNDEIMDILKGLLTREGMLPADNEVVHLSNGKLISNYDFSSRSIVNLLNPPGDIAISKGGLKRILEYPD